MGGTIWVESEEGQGSTFHCTLVVEHAEATSPERALLFPVAPRIVLVEPHAHARMALAHRLAGMNVCVEACASVEEAERALLFGRPAALLSGYSSGVEFERLRDLSTRVGLPILTMLWVSEAANARAIGAERVLYRPVRSTPLFTKLRDAATRTVSVAPSPDPEGTASREVLIRIAHPLHQKILAKMLTEQGSSVGMVPSLEAWSADSRRTECLTFFDLETVEDALLADPCRRFDEGSSRLVVVAMALDRTRRQKLESAGVAAFLALPVQPAALQRVLADASETRRATLRPNDAPVTS
jgi:DNA-binding NtrC family response regulator